MDSNVLIRVFDTELNYLGQVDDYESLIFRRKWSGYGEFEITLGYCSPILQARRFILLDEDPKRSGCIEYVQYDEAKGTYTVKGFSLLKLLETRITVPPKGKANQSYQGTPAEILRPEILRDIFGIEAEISTGTDGIPYCIPTGSVKEDQR